MTDRSEVDRHVIVSLGRALLDRLRAGGKAIVQRSDQIPLAPDLSGLDKMLDALATGSIVAVENLSYTLIAIDKSRGQGPQRPSSRPLAIDECRSLACP